MIDLVGRNHAEKNAHRQRGSRLSLNSKGALGAPAPFSLNMPTIDQRELDICAEQRNEEWDVLSVWSISQVHANCLQCCSQSTPTVSPGMPRMIS